MSLSAPHIESLLTQFSLGTASESEVDELFAVLGEAGADEMFASLMVSQLENSAPGEEDAEYWQERLIAMPGLITGQGSIKTGKVMKFRSWYWAASIIFVMLSTALIFMLSRNPSQGEQPAVVEVNNPEGIKPGSNKAILKLGDGTEIVLDSSTSGSIAKQGSITITGSSGGRVEYSHDELSQITQWNTMTTPKGGQYQVTLSDGTKVWLNAGSSITYPVAFVDSQRKVSITGEVYFEVGKNRVKPFIVDIGNGAAIRVTGTHFNINAYANENATEVTLFEGSVEVYNSEKRFSKTLIPGQQALIKKDNDILMQEGVDLDRIIAWKNGLFNFNDAGLKEVMRQLERWYDIEVIYEGQVPSVIFDGKMDRQLTLSQVIKILMKSEIQYKVEGRKLIIGKK